MTLLFQQKASILFTGTLHDIKQKVISFPLQRTVPLSVWNNSVSTINENIQQ